jgi:hypothetical protein
MRATEPAASIMTEDQARSHAEALAIGITFYIVCDPEGRRLLSVQNAPAALRDGGGERPAEQPGTRATGRTPDPAALPLNGNPPEARVVSRASATCRAGQNDQASTRRGGRRGVDVGRRLRAGSPSRAAATSVQYATGAGGVMAQLSAPQFSSSQAVTWEWR